MNGLMCNLVTWSNCSIVFKNLTKIPKKLEKELNMSEENDRGSKEN